MMDDFNELKMLYDACGSGKVDEVKAILKDRSLYIGWRNRADGDVTCLHMACWYGRTQIVPLLLAYPGINVNQSDSAGWNAFFFACHYGRTEVVRQLLRDGRLMINMPACEGETPLSSAAKRGHFDVVKWIIASGKKFTLGRKGKSSDPIAQATRKGHTELAAFLERYQANQDQTRHEVRLEIGYYAEMAAERFALVVFFCDGLVSIKPTASKLTVSKMINARKYFAIAKRLPMDLQMVLCNRGVGSMKDVVLPVDSEAAFKSIAKKFQPPF